MANVKLIFNGTDLSDTHTHYLIVYANTNQEIYLSIKMDDYSPSFICLDKPTAVRLVRELKKQIGFLESEVYNG